MVRLDLLSIAYEANKLNLARSGYASFYVDGLLGNDVHDGGSWGQAFKTIQHAIDQSGSWAKIFVKSKPNSDLSLDAPSGQKEVAVVDGTVFASGDVVIIREDDYTERATIDSILGDVLTMETDLTNSYTTADNGRVIEVYDENVSIDEDNITIIGEDPDLTIVSSATGDTISTVAKIQNCDISQIGAVCGEDYKCGILFNGDNSVCWDCNFDTSGSTKVYGCGVAPGVANAELHGLRSETAAIYAVIVVKGEYSKVYNCTIDGAMYGIVLEAATATNCEVHDNNLLNCTQFGVLIWSSASKNSVYHNNFISNANQIMDSGGSDNEFVENFFDNHTTDTNNDGRADTAYTELGATDNQPVSRRIGWRQESLGIGIGGSGDATAANQVLILAAVAGIRDLDRHGADVPVTGIETNLYEDPTPTAIVDARSIKIDMSNIGAADTYEFKEYYKIESGGAYLEVADTITLVGVQADPLYVMHLDPYQYGLKVTARKVAGTDRNFKVEVMRAI